MYIYIHQYSNKEHQPYNNLFRFALDRPTTANVEEPTRSFLPCIACFCCSTNADHLGTHIQLASHFLNSYAVLF